MVTETVRSGEEPAARRGNGNSVFASGKAAGFDHPIDRPRNAEQHRDWQAANRAWWEAAPLRYDWREALHQEPGSKDFFAEIDRRFFAATRAFLPWRTVPFDSLIAFDTLADQEVLEIGVGHGTHAQLLASRCKSYVGIDLTAAAAQMTTRRLSLFDIPGEVLQMDAEKLAFADNSFDYLWSWGVIHQTADTQRVLAEMHRVLRPGGRCTVMVYYRSWWNYYVSGFLRGAVAGRLFKPGVSLHRLAQSGTDGAIARYYKPSEWRDAVRGLFISDEVTIHGLKTDAVPLPYGRLKTAVMKALPDAVTRFLTRRLRMGSLLIVQMHKAGSGV